jgi:hypothetical protein
MERSPIFLTKAEINESKSELKSEVINDTTDRMEMNSDLQIEELKENKEKEKEKEIIKEEENENEKPQKIESTFLTEPLEEKRIKDNETKEEEANVGVEIKDEEKKEKVGKYYFPMIITKVKKEDYNSISFLLKHPPKPIDTSKKINFKTNPGLYRGPVKLPEKPKRDLSPLNDLMVYINEMFHMPASSRSISLPYDNFRERLKHQFFSRNHKYFGNFKFPPKSIVHHKFNENYKEEQIFVKARNIAIEKLPKINKNQFHFSTQSNVPKGAVKDYNINNPY